MAGRAKKHQPTKSDSAVAMVGVNPKGGGGILTFACYKGSAAALTSPPPPQKKKKKKKKKNANNFWHTQTNACEFHPTPEIPGL